MADVTREAVKSIKYLISKFPCVVVVGARQVGKTTLISQVLPNVRHYDLEKRVDYNLIDADPDFFLSQQKYPVVIDEAQLCPKLFPALRVAIDKNRKHAGQFLLSGSSSPQLLNLITESLAGRVAIFELGGLSLNESWGTKNNCLLELINTQNIQNVIDQSSPKFTYDQIFKSCVYGSYPEPFLNHSDLKYHIIWMENYFQTYVERDIRRLFPRLDINTYQRFIYMLSHASGEILNASNFSRSLGVSQPTIKSYLTIADGSFIWRNLRSFDKSVKKQVTKMPKGYIRDSGLLCHLFKIRNKEDFFNHPHSGRIWETFIIEKIINSFLCELVSIDYYYYRTKSKAEIDLILHGDFGIIPIEIKLTSNINPRQLFTLKNFIKTHNPKFAVIINNSEYMEWIAPKILQIPSTYL